jgi:His/Glu/Gln/Arg/opine family amino acid ABC transporter permease subunit
MTYDWHVLVQYHLMLLEGLQATILITLTALGTGLVLGLGLCAASLRRRGWLYLSARTYIDLLRTVPEMVLIFWVYFCFPPLLDWTLSGIASGTLALSLVAAAYLSEILRAGIESLPKGQTDAAHALGLGLYARWRFIILPQAVRRMMPAFVNYLTELLKNSTLLSAIGVGELVYQASTAGAQTFRYMEFLSAIGIGFFVVIFPLSLYVRQAESRRIRTRR